MQYELLGPLRLVESEFRAFNTPKVETLLATLLIRANQPVSTDHLMLQLWGDSPPRRCRAALHVYVSQLRKALAGLSAGAVVRTHGQGYRLEADEDSIDSVRLRRLHEEGRMLLDDDPERALAAFQEAVGLFRGPVLAGVGDGLFIGAFVRWAEETRLECREAVAQCSLRVGRHRELIGDLSVWVDENPLNETLREQLMLALFRSGRRAEALEVFQSARRALREELGLDPRATMYRLQAAILRADADDFRVAS
ncbi:BTAD domain-containing putative transcriptional regulator [Actinomadura sp. 9N215]|uniref:AfsR/SARP family transcriptional regulator n=1 Tax=Actinomadura sp. 9N215 TaxID=3375150 RepID=UPI0037B55413